MRGWDTFVYGAANPIPDALRVAPQTGVPETQHLDTARNQKRLTLGVVVPLRWMTVVAPIQFNRQPRFLAKEIEVVDALGILAAKLVIAKTAVAQPAPHQFLGPGFVLAQLAGALDVSHFATVQNEDGKENRVLGSPSP